MERPKHAADLRSIVALNLVRRAALVIIMPGSSDNSDPIRNQPTFLYGRDWSQPSATGCALTPGAGSNGRVARGVAQPIAGASMRFRVEWHAAGVHPWDDRYADIGGNEPKAPWCRLPASRWSSRTSCVISRLRQLFWRSLLQLSQEARMSGHSAVLWQGDV